MKKAGANCWAEGRDGTSKSQEEEEEEEQIQGRRGDFWPRVETRRKQKSCKILGKLEQAASDTSG